MNFESGNLDDTWKDWREETELYLALVDNGKADEQRKCAILRYCLGNEGRRIIETTSAAKAEDKTVKKYMDALEEYCKPKKTLILDTHIFDGYLIELRKLGSKCDLNDLMERMIMHVIVVCIKNSALREQLLAKKTLNLEHAVEICRAAESSRLYSEEIETGEATASVNAFHE